MPKPSYKGKIKCKVWDAGEHLTLYTLNRAVHYCQETGLDEVIVQHNGEHVLVITRYADIRKAP